MANKGRWMERKAAQKRYWKEICQSMKRTSIEFKASYEKACWIEDQKKAHPTLFS